MRGENTSYDCNYNFNFVEVLHTSRYTCNLPDVRTYVCMIQFKRFMHKGRHGYVHVYMTDAIIDL